MELEKIAEVLRKLIEDKDNEILANRERISVMTLENTTLKDRIRFLEKELLTKTEVQ